jgi:hypothetical protein
MGTTRVMAQTSCEVAAPSETRPVIRISSWSLALHPFGSNTFPRLDPSYRWPGMCARFALSLVVCTDVCNLAGRPKARSSTLSSSRQWRRPRSSLDGRHRWRSSFGECWREVCATLISPSFFTYLGYFKPFVCCFPSFAVFPFFL